MIRMKPAQSLLYVFIAWMEEVYLRFADPEFTTSLLNCDADQHGVAGLNARGKNYSLHWLSLYFLCFTTPLCRGFWTELFHLAPMKCGNALIIACQANVTDSHWSERN